MHYEEAIICYYPGCGMCARLRDLGDQDGTGWTCDAFPDGIPASVVRHEDSHDTPIPGDNGIQYEPRVNIPEGKKIGYYFDWEGDVHDAETHKTIEFEREVR